jgi:hypothetical protein
MITSVIGYMVTQGDGGNQLSYNGFDFQTSGYNGWLTDVDGKSARFTYHPSEIDNINISPDVINHLKNTKMVFLSFDPEDVSIQRIELARLELDQQLPAFFNIFPVTGVSNRTGTYAAFPEVDCRNATIFIPVLQFRTDPDGGRPSIESNGSCIILEAGSPDDIVILKDRLLYGMLGVIQ